MQGVLAGFTMLLAVQVSLLTPYGVAEDTVDIIGTVVNELSVTVEQAQRGVGAILAASKKKMSAESYEQLQGVILNESWLIERMPPVILKEGIDENSDVGIQETLTAQFGMLQLPQTMKSQFAMVMLAHIHSIDGLQLSGEFRNSLPAELFGTVRVEGWEWKELVLRVITKLIMAIMDDFL